MKNRYLRARGVIVVLVGMLLLLVGAAACSSGDDEAVDLLKDPKVGLEHLNAELHAIKGEDSLAHPKHGLEHLNQELHTDRDLATDPKVGFAHLNDEFHALKQAIADHRACHLSDCAHTAREWQIPLGEQEVGA